MKGIQIVLASALEDAHTLAVFYYAMQRDGTFPPAELHQQLLAAAVDLAGSAAKLRVLLEETANADSSPGEVADFLADRPADRGGNPLA